MGGPRRWSYNLDGRIMSCGQIGAMQTLFRRRVVAGDSISCNIKSVFRLSPLRRNLYLDAEVMLALVFIPYRHIYSNWADFMLAGPDEGVTLGTVTVTNGLFCTGAPFTSGQVIPTYASAGYIQFWNRYMRHPTDDAAIKAETYLNSLASGSDEQYFGVPVTPLRRLWNSGIDEEVAAADKRFALVDTDKIDLLLLEQQKGHLKAERRREWFGQRYTDLMGAIYGSDVSIDADKRPLLLKVARGMLSGYDVDGTDDASLGQYSGKAHSVGSIYMPPRFIPEHGTLWCFAVVRFPAVHQYSMDPMDNTPEPTYAQFACDPDVVARQPPETVDLSKYIRTATATDVGVVPYAQHYREGFDVVHQKYSVQQSHPFIERTITTKAAARYCVPTEYNKVFQNLQMGHWQSQGEAQIRVRRCLPDVMASIFAGTD